MYIRSLTPSQIEYGIQKILPIRSGLMKDHSLISILVNPLAQLVYPSPWSSLLHILSFNRMIFVWWMIIKAVGVTVRRHIESYNTVLSHSIVLPMQCHLDTVS